jgi:hypothetical protein
MSITIDKECTVCGDEFIAFTDSTRRCPDCRSADRRPNRVKAKFEVEVIGPNLHTRGESFHVHRQGCADIKRDPKRYGYSQYTGMEWRMKVATLTEVCDAVYPPSDFDCNSGDYLDDFKVFPCVGDLPD